MEESASHHVIINGMCFLVRLAPGPSRIHVVVLKMTFQKIDIFKISGDFEGIKVLLPMQRFCTLSCSRGAQGMHIDTFSDDSDTRWPVTKSDLPEV